MIDVDLSMLTDDELANLAGSRPRDFTNSLSHVNDYPNAIFAERQRRHEARVRGPLPRKPAGRAPAGVVDPNGQRPEVDRQAIGLVVSQPMSG
ncbi:MAG: hypothetical protein ACREPM_02670 [Gemmatimonadaceae bacterium]